MATGHPSPHSSSGARTVFTDDRRDEEEERNARGEVKNSEGRGVRAKRRLEGQKKGGKAKEEGEREEQRRV